MSPTNAPLAGHRLLSRRRCHRCRTRFGRSNCAVNNGSIMVRAMTRHGRHLTVIHRTRHGRHCGTTLHSSTAVPRTSGRCRRLAHRRHCRLNTTRRILFTYVSVNTRTMGTLLSRLSLRTLGTRLHRRLGATDNRHGVHTIHHLRMMRTFHRSKGHPR